MSHNIWVRDLLISEIRYRSRLSEETMDLIASSFMEKLESRRHTLVPIYLTDEMYEAQKRIDGDLDYRTANSMYSAAITEYNRISERPAQDDEQYGFW